MHTQKVNLIIPDRYFEFWEKIRGFYGLQEDSIDQVISEQFINHLNMLYEELASQPVIGGCEIRRSLEL